MRLLRREAQLAADVLREFAAPGFPDQPGFFRGRNKDHQPRGAFDIPACVFVSFWGAHVPLLPPAPELRLDAMTI